MAAADDYQVPADYVNDVAQRESMYWVGTHHATDNEQGLYEEPYPCECKEYKTQRGSLRVTYTHGQEECGGNTAGFHLQFYVEFEKKVKLTTLKNVFSKRIHWEIRKGTSEQADDYCGKDDTRVADGISWKHGTRSAVKQGQRTDLDSVVTALKQGMKRKAIAENFGVAYIKFHKGIEAMAQALDISLEEKQPTYIDRTCMIFFGAPGSGKSTAAMRMMDGDTFYQPQKSNGSVLSFESYTGQHWIFLDDFEPSQLSRGTLKEIMDNRACQLPGRGSNSSKAGRHKGVIITSQEDPETWYDKADAVSKIHWEAIRRRCKTVWKCGETDPIDPTADWMSLGGKDPEWPAGKLLESPLEELTAWAIKKQADELAAALSATAPSGIASSQSQDGSQENPIAIEE